MVEAGQSRTTYDQLPLACFAVNLANAQLDRQARQEPATFNQLRSATVTNEYTLQLIEDCADIETVGGKGASLARLTRAGLPVPGGFHVTTQAYRQFVAGNRLQEQILAALEKVDASQPSTLEHASQAIIKLFAGAQIPPDIASAILQAYSALPGANPAVAVRSSATAEDLPEASFAGQQETYLNVSGPEAVLKAVKKCWASLWTARAIAYRIRQGISPESVALAVVVQVLIPAEAAGILFTADPVTGQRNRAMISAAWGLGEAVVGGLVTPDTITVDKENGRIISQQVADKRVMTVRVDGGTQEQPVPESLRRVPVLGEDVASALTRLGTQIEGLYGQPMDIEWALYDGKLHIVQARPITALPKPELPVPTEWPVPNPKGMYSRGSMAEHLPNPVSPLFATLGLRIANQAILALGKDYLGVEDASDYQYLTINGYTYMGIVMGLREYWIFTKAIFSQLGNIFGKGTERWQVARKAPADLIARWEAKPMEALSPTALWAGVDEIFTEIAHLYTVIQAGTLPTATTSETLFTQFYNRLVKRPGDPDATAFLFGFDTLPILAEKSLYDMAAWCRGRSSLCEHIIHTPAADLADELQSAQPPAEISSGDWGGWRERFQAHIHTYGHTAYDFDFASPAPADAPQPLLEAIKMYLGGEGKDPYARQEVFVEQREQATQAMLSRLRWPLRGWFLKLLRWAQRTVPVREDSLADMGMGHPQIRRLLGELGRRFTEGNAIQNADDIYWLTEEEVNELAGLLERGETLPNYSGRIPPRKDLWRSQLKAVPPAVLPQNSRWARMVPWADQNQGDTQVLKGVGTSAGVATAPACVLYGPDDFSRMRPGDVLVATTTTPAWTPLFAMASAVVTDIGGPLSHSSIVAREYGIPAVMATGVATRRIQSGQIITVDGRAGLVTLS
jgi:phosphoenolpyruvate synthase/pyruvate phosphate dikinase